MFVVLGAADIFVIGGVYTNRAQHLSVSASGVVTPAQDEPPVPVHRVNTASSVVDDHGRITLMGGYTEVNSSIMLDLVWHLETTDPTPQWTRGPDLLSPRWRHIGFQLGTQIYVCMGEIPDEELGGIESTMVSSLDMLDTTQSFPIWELSQPSYPLIVVDAACVVIQRQGMDEV